jgi:hypothetical protein
MSSGFSSAVRTVDISKLSSFNEPVAAAAFFTIGEHDVAVESAEVHNYGHGDTLVVNWSSPAGTTIKQFITLYYDDEKTGKRAISSKYAAFAKAFASEVELRTKFFYKEAMADTLILGALKGLKAKVKIVKGRKGYEIATLPTGLFVVQDVVTGKQLMNDEFGSMSDANEAAKAVGLKRAFNEVGLVIPIKEELEKNEQSVRSALSSKPETPVASTLQRISML